MVPALTGLVPTGHGIYCVLETSLQLTHRTSSAGVLGARGRRQKASAATTEPPHHPVLPSIAAAIHRRCHPSALPSIGAAIHRCCHTLVLLSIGAAIHRRCHHRRCQGLSSTLRSLGALLAPWHCSSTGDPAAGHIPWGDQACRAGGVGGGRKTGG